MSLKLFAFIVIERIVKPLVMMPALLLWRALSEFWCRSSTPFFLATDENSSARSTAPIHKEKFNVPLSEDHKELFKFQGFNGRPITLVISGSFIVLRYEELIPCCSSLTTRVKSKYQPKGKSTY